MLLMLFIFSISIHSSAQSNYYFPPLNSDSWEEVAPVSLGWDTSRLSSLRDFLEDSNTKAFLILYDGRLAVEWYFGDFTQDSVWYWASAGKTLTSFLVGLAQQEGNLNINLPSSTYLGTGWTTATPEQEAAITVRHQLTMTSGLNDAIDDPYCTDPQCLTYLATAGSRWAYHNGPYTLLDEVIASATEQSINSYFNNRVRSRTGITGMFLRLGYNNVFFSRARSMARFGSLILNRGVWNGDSLMYDQAYFTAMTSPSQSINPSYGYLWWLNGQASYMLPGLQLNLPGFLVPEAPADMIAALGANDQKLYVIPSKKLVVVRLGLPTGGDISPVPVIFDRALWTRLSTILMPPTRIVDRAIASPLLLYPQPAHELLCIDYPNSLADDRIFIYNAFGQVVISQPFDKQLNIQQLPDGNYFLQVRSSQGWLKASNQWIKQ
jgi:CubicO group peptidase (beta-lactamase class C family)